MIAYMPFFSAFNFSVQTNHKIMKLSIALLASALAAAHGAFQEGDSCGVTSADFVNVDFSGDYLVAGEAGCALGSDTKCYCAPNLADGESLGEWEWQCNGTVNFGPADGKQCPETVPVPKNSDILGLVPKQVSIMVDVLVSDAEAFSNRLTLNLPSS